MKLNLKLLGGVLLLAIPLFIAGYCAVRAESCRRIIDRESNKPGLTCLWRFGDEQDVRQTPSLWQVIRGARPTYIHIEWPGFESDHQGASEFAEALRFFGSLEEFGVGYNCPEIMTLLSGVGWQPHLTQIQCFNSPVTDALSQAVIGFPHLREISLVPSQFTGQGFPSMPDLEAADLSWCPITADGLRAIAASPKLTMIKLSDHPNPTPLLYEVIKELHTSQKSLDISGLEAP